VTFVGNIATKSQRITKQPSSDSYGRAFSPSGTIHQAFNKLAFLSHFHYDDHDY